MLAQVLEQGTTHGLSPWKIWIKPFLNHKANVDQIRQEISEFSWYHRFANVNVNEQVQLFAQAIQNITSLLKNLSFSAFVWDRNKTDLFNKFQSLQAHLKTTTEESKQKYYCRLSDKLLDSKTS